MDNFTEYEKKERKFLNWYINHKEEHKIFDESEIGSYECNDFVMLSGRTYVMGEIKMRSFEYDKYPTVVIELDKVNRLMKKFLPYYQMGKTNKLYYYAVYKKSRKILVFDIMNTPSTITYEMCPKTTAEDNGWELKPMVNYKLEDVLEIIDVKKKGEN